MKKQFTKTATSILSKILGREIETDLEEKIIEFMSLTWKNESYFSRRSEFKTYNQKDRLVSYEVYWGLKYLKNANLINGVDWMPLCTLNFGALCFLIEDYPELPLSDAIKYCIEFEENGSPCFFGGQSAGGLFFCGLSVWHQLTEFNYEFKNMKKNNFRVFYLDLKEQGIFEFYSAREALIGDLNVSDLSQHALVIFINEIVPLWEYSNQLWGWHSKSKLSFILNIDYVDQIRSQVNLQNFLEGLIGYNTNYVLSKMKTSETTNKIISILRLNILDKDYLIKKSCECPIFGSLFSEKISKETIPCIIALARENEWLEELTDEYLLKWYSFTFDIKYFKKFITEKSLKNKINNAILLNSKKSYLSSTSGNGRSESSYSAHSHIGRH